MEFLGGEMTSEDQGGDSWAWGVQGTASRTVTRSLASRGRCRARGQKGQHEDKAGPMGLTFAPEERGTP